MPVAPRSVLSVRVSPEAKQRLEERAAAEDTTVSKLTSQLLDRPSLSDALRTLQAAVETPEDRGHTLELAGHARLAAVTAADLRALASGLNALAARWPR